MNYQITPESKPHLDVGDTALASSIAIALYRLGLVEVSGAVSHFVDLGGGILAMVAAAPVGFASDGQYILTLTGCGPYSGDWPVQSNSPTELVLSDAYWQGAWTGGSWKIKQIV